MYCAQQTANSVASIDSTMSLFGKTALPGYSRMSFRSYLILSRKNAYLNNGHKPDRAAIKIKFQNECQGKQLPRIEGDKQNRQLDSINSGLALRSSTGQKQNRHNIVINTIPSNECAG